MGDAIPGEGGEEGVLCGGMLPLLAAMVFYWGKMISVCVFCVEAVVDLENFVVDGIWWTIVLYPFLFLFLVHDLDLVLCLCHVPLPLDACWELLDCSSFQ